LIAMLDRKSIDNKTQGLYLLPSSFRTNIYCKNFHIPVWVDCIRNSEHTLRVHPMSCKVVHFYVRKSLSQSEQNSNFSLLIWLTGTFTHVEMYDFTRPRVYPFYLYLAWKKSEWDKKFLPVSINLFIVAHK